MPDRQQSESTRLDSTQQLLFDALKAQGVEGHSVLEIGCGAGRLHQHLLEEGASSAVGIELIAEQVEKAKASAHNLGLDDRAMYFKGDFMKLAAEIEPADITILDKVVHCYHDPRLLIRESAAHTKSVYAVAFPAKRPLLAMSMRLLSPILRLFLPFRVRFFPPDTIRAWIRENGFERTFQQDTEMWHTEIYARCEESDKQQLPRGE
ncbi:class I SAM-dependent methyltransferase [Candidatus Bipolaricaulota bacterium]